MLGVIAEGRKQGACTRCRIKKRKCDQAQPRCGQCTRKNENCTLGVFKVTNGPKFPPNPAPRRRTHRSKDIRKKPGTGSGRSPEDKGIEESIPSPIVREQDTVAVPEEHIVERQADTRVFIDNVYTTSQHGLHARGGGTPEPVYEHAETYDDVEELPRGDMCIVHPQRAQSLLPVDIYQSTLRRFLWDYFVNKASQIFLCWEEPRSLGQHSNYSDLYTESLPALAMESGPMRSATLALSAFHYSGGGGERIDRPTITSLMMEASQALAASRWVEPQSEKQLLATVGTTALLYLLEPKVYSDMLTLSRSAALALMANNNSQISGDTSYQVVMQIFRWADICAQCSLMQYVPIPDESTQHRLGIRADERAAQLPRSYAGWFVHPLYAFSEDLIAPLRLIAWLIRVRQQGHIAQNNDNDVTEAGDDEVSSSVGTSFSISEAHFESLVLEAEQQISAARTNVSTSLDPSAPAQDLEAGLKHIAAAVHSAIVILFLTRLRDRPWTSKEVRFHVTNVVEHLCSLKPDSKFSNGVVFPLIVAGVEAVDQIHRKSIADRLKYLPGIWSRQEARLIEGLEHIWDIRDRDPGAVWNTWIHRVSADFTTCIPA